MVARRSIRFVYAGLRVRNLERSLRFYQALGFRVRRRGTMEHGGAWVHLGMPRSGRRLELNYYPRGNPYYAAYRSGSEMDHLGFSVDNVDRWVERMRRVGAGVPIPAFSETHERLGFVTDPDGIWVEFVGPVRPPRRRRPVKRP